MKGPTMAKSAPRKSRLAGRDAGTGKFIPVDKARNDKGGAVVERLPLPGYGLGDK